MTEAQGDELIDLLQELVDQGALYDDVNYYYEVPSTTFGASPVTTTTQQLRVNHAVDTGDFLIASVLVIAALLQVVRSVFNASRGLAA